MIPQVRRKITRNAGRRRVMRTAVAGRTSPGWRCEWRSRSGIARSPNHRLAPGASHRVSWPTVLAGIDNPSLVFPQGEEGRAMKEGIKR
jgi:hypothetical protein